MESHKPIHSNWSNISCGRVYLTRIYGRLRFTARVIWAKVEERTPRMLSIWIITLWLMGKKIYTNWICRFLLDPNFLGCLLNLLSWFLGDQSWRWFLDQLFGLKFAGSIRSTYYISANMSWGKQDGKTNGRSESIRIPLMVCLCVRKYVSRMTDALIFRISRQCSNFAHTWVPYVFLRLLCAQVCVFPFREGITAIG